MVDGEEFEALLGALLSTVKIIRVPLTKEQLKKHEELHALVRELLHKETN